MAQFYKISTLLLGVALASCQSASDSKISAITDNDTQNASQIESPEDLALTQDGVQQPYPDDVDKMSVAASIVNASGVVNAYTPPKTGTVFTWRNNWASLPDIISYKVAGVVELGSKQYVKFTSVKGLKANTQAYYDTTDFNLKGYRDAKNSALVTFKPAEQRYRFPLKPGDKWVTSWKSKDHQKNEVTSGGGVVQVIKMETLKLPAGEFKAMKVRIPMPKTATKGMKHYVWFSPKLGITIKEQIGNGSMNWTQVLEKVTPPVS